MTNDDIIDGDFSDDEMIAAEFALGLLDSDVHAQMARRVLVDPKFADLVEDWDMRFAQMAEGIAPVAPPKGLFKKITNDAYPDSPKRLWQQLGVLPALLCAGLAALVLMIAVNFAGVGPINGPAATLTARMAADDSSIVVAAAFVEDSGSLFVEWQVGTRLPDRDVELWVIVDGDAPVSVGVLDKGTPITEFNVPANLRDQLLGAAMAVSDEPLGGSPTGAPTGAVLAVGAIVAL